MSCRAESLARIARRAAESLRDSGGPAGGAADPAAAPRGAATACLRNHCRLRRLRGHRPALAHDPDKPDHPPGAAACEGWGRESRREGGASPSTQRPRGAAMATARGLLHCSWSRPPPPRPGLAAEAGPDKAGELAAIPPASSAPAPRRRVPGRRAEPHRPKPETTTITCSRVISRWTPRVRSQRKSTVTPPGAMRPFRRPKHAVHRLASAVAPHTPVAHPQHQSLARSSVEAGTGGAGQAEGPRAPVSPRPSAGSPPGRHADAARGWGDNAGRP